MVRELCYSMVYIECSACPRTAIAAQVKGPIMAISTPDVVSRYLTAQAARDFDTLVTLFADDAIVIDEGKTMRGTKEIRAWRENVASVYEYTTELVGVEAAGEGKYVARVHLEGNFPGGTVDLRYRFNVDGDSIRRLEIAP
jgi:ketosteroid isomerase-like protein